MRASGARVTFYTVFSTLVASLGIVALPLAPAQAAPPANDDFADAQVLSGYGVTTGTNVEATREAGEPAHSGYAEGASVWYSWTAPVGVGDVEIEVLDADFDPNLAVYTGSAVNALTMIEFDDDAGLGDLPKIELDAVASTTYYIAVDACCGGFSEVEPGSFQLRVSAVTVGATGTVSGTVTRTNPADVSGPAIAAGSICIIALDTGGNRVGRSATTNGSGAYSLTLPAGTYHLQLRNCGTQNVAGEFYQDAQTNGAATNVVVTGGGSQTVNALLGLGGTISGTIGAEGGLPAGTDLEDVCVRATMVGGADDGFSRTTTTDADGDYTITGLDGGDYRIRFGGNRVGSCGASNIDFTTEYFDDSPTAAGATLVTVTEGTTTDVDADLLAVPGSITGTVTALAGGAPLQNVCVRTVSPDISDYAYTSASGTYTIPGVAAGSSWVVEFSDCNTVGPYTTQYYDSVLVEDDADEVQVLAGQTTPGIDAQMFQAITFSGRITDENGNGRSPACVDIHTANGATVLGVTTAPDGTWSGSVPPGSYDLEMKDCGAGGLEFETRWYLDELDQTSADKFSTSQTNLDQMLPGLPGSPGRVTGTVTDDASEPLQGICVVADKGGIETEATTDADGHYEFELTAGNHTIYFEQCDHYADYSVLAQYWDDVPVGGTPTNVVVLAGSTTAGIGAQMHPGGTIEGIVTNQDGTIPLEDICVTAYLDPDDPYPSFVTEVYSLASGEYRLAGLPTDVYFLTYEDCTGEYAGQWYHGIPFTSIVDITPVGDPTPVDVTVGETETLDPTRLERYATVSGTVTNEAGDPLENVCVFVESDNPDFYPISTYTDENGYYQLGELTGTTGPENEYRVGFYGCLPPTEDYGLEYWDNKLSESTADLIAAEMGEDILDIDAVLQDEPPVNTAPPTILGQTSIGMTLKATNGEWDHEPSEFSFEWYRCDADGSNCTLANSGDRRYLLGDDDEGHRIRADVTAFNSKGSDIASSSLSDVVDDAAPFNDDIQDRETLLGALPLEAWGSNVRGTRQVGEPKHLGYPEGSSVWYQWTAPIGPSEVEALRISLDGTDFESTLSVYDGTPFPFDLDLVAEANGLYSSNGVTELTFYPEPGTTYYIAVDGNYDGADFETGAIEMRLSAGRGITGTVTDENGDPIRTICAEAEDTDDPMEFYDAYTGADGSYYIDAPPGTYVVSFTDCIGEYEDQFYDGVTDPEDATEVVVADGAVTHDIDATMVRIEQFGTISGTVTDEDGDPIPNICVIPVSPIYGPQVLSVDCTDQDGTYQLRGLGDPDSPAQLDYYVWFDDCSCFWGSEFYDNVPYDYPDDATLVSVSRSQHIAGINATMQYLPPTNATLPTITGNTGTIGSTLTATNGTWTHEPSVFEYEWQRCNSSGGSCAPIDGADDQTYVTTGDDAGLRLRVVVTAINSIGSDDATSAASNRIGAPTNTVRPTISGTLTVGSTLTATTGAWTGSPTQYDYQWLRCNTATVGCVPIGSATTNQYVLTGDDNDHTIRVAVTATNANGTATANSYGTNVIGAPTNTVRPTISGQLTVGSTLTATSGGWTGSPSQYDYQWLRCDTATVNCLPISSATTNQYVLTGDDTNHTIRVAVTASNTHGATTAQSYGTNVIGAPTNTVRPTISGQLTVGSTLSATSGTWTGSPTQYNYQWLRCNTATVNCVPIGSATTNQYVLTGSDTGQTIRIEVTAVNASGSTAAQSYGTTVIGAPVSLDRPVISGTLTVGSTLTASVSTFANTPDDHQFQWLRCNAATVSCTEIVGADESTYVVSDDDLDTTLRVRLTASNGHGSTAVHSYGTTVIGAPTNTARPAISGTVTVGSTLSSSTGAWTGDPTGYDYQWLSCDSATVNCTPIAGADDPTYEIESGDTGDTLRVAVTATNAHGTATARSWGTAAVP